MNSQPTMQTLTNPPITATENERPYQISEMPSKLDLPINVTVLFSIMQDTGLLLSSKDNCYIRRWLWRIKRQWHQEER